MAPCRNVKDSQVDTLIAEVQSETVIWNVSDPNHQNKYQVNLAFDRVAKKLKCSTKAVREKWKEICDERKNNIREKPNLTSGSAGGESSRDSWFQINQLNFLKDSRKPCNPSRSGNLQSILQQPETLSVSTDHTTISSANPPAASLGTSDDQFFGSMLHYMDDLSDKEKLYLRIEMTNVLLEHVKNEKANTCNEDDIVYLGAWMPNNASNEHEILSIKEEIDCNTKVESPY